MKRLAALAVAAALMVPAAAYAVTGTVDATATVLTPLSVSTDLRALDFGNVFPGVNKSIAYSDGTSGKWEIIGAPGAEVQLQFTLPTNLSDGSNNLPISFANNDAAYANLDNVGGAVAFDPASPSAQLLAAGGGGWVWLGGTVAPVASQAAGTYTATVSLDVVYTGN